MLERIQLDSVLDARLGKVSSTCEAPMIQTTLPLKAPAGVRPFDSRLRSASPLRSNQLPDCSVANTVSNPALTGVELHEHYEGLGYLKQELGCAIPHLALQTIYDMLSCQH